MKLLKSFLVLFFFVYFGQLKAQQWTQTNGPEGGNVYAVENSGSYLFAGLAPGGVYRSTNFGANWFISNSGIAESDRNVKALHAFNNNIYAGSINGLYRSTDNGTNWSKVTAYLGNTITDINSANNFLYVAAYGGISVSSDNGSTWTINNIGMTNLYVTAIAFVNNNLVAATEGGIFISTDNGINWSNISSGLTNMFINDIAVKGNNIFAATGGGGLFKSTNSGANWFYSGTGIQYPNVLSIEVHDSVLFAADYSSGIYSSTNNGFSWENVTFLNGMPNNPITWCLHSTGSMLFAGLLGDGIYGTTNSGLSWLYSNNGIIATSVNSVTSANGLIFAGTQRRIFSTSDNGNTWLLSSGGLNCTYFTSLNTSGTDIYAGTSGGCGMYLSTNNGVYWQNINSGLGYGPINDIAISPGNVFVSTQTGVFRSTNRGSFWFPVNNGLTSFYTDMLKYFNGSLFVYTYDGLFRSTDNGGNWTASWTGIPQFAYVDDLTMHNGLLFAATTSGVYLSSNNGSTWQVRNNGLQFNGTNAIVSAGSFLVVSHYNKFSYSSNNGSNWLPLNTGFNSICNTLYISDSSIFAGTQESGAYKFDRNVIGIDPVAGEIPNDYRLYDNYPNPFNPVTKIRFSIPRSSDISLRIYDIKGSLAELFSGNISAGIHEFEWNAQSFASGIYFYTIESNNYKETKKMVLIK